MGQQIWIWAGFEKQELDNIGGYMFHRKMEKGFSPSFNGFLLVLKSVGSLPQHIVHLLELTVLIVKDKLNQS